MTLGPTERLETESYLVTRYQQDPTRLVVAFASAGAWGPGEPIEEFRTSLLRTGVSAAFVVSRSPQWYNDPAAPALFEMLAGLTQSYPAAAALGESMGACGALALGHIAPNLGRILAFSPQYSIAPPFVDFDHRYREIGRGLPQHVWSDFAFEDVIGRTTLLAGSTDPLDPIHLGMLAAHGFRPILIEGAPHGVAAFLKTHASGNRLQPLLNAFCDLHAPFGPWTASAMLQDLTVRVPARPLAPSAQPQPMPPPPGLDLAFGKRATQSSLSPWSAGEDEACRAVSRFFNPDYSFHTGLDDPPWWQVDLGAPAELGEVRYIHRASHPARFAHLSVLVGMAPDRLAPAALEALSGPPGCIVTARLSTPLRARYVRLAGPGRGLLHLSRVQIFGPRA